MKVLIVNQHGLNRGDEAAARALAGFLDKEPAVAQVEILYNIADLTDPEKLTFPGVKKKWSHHSGHRPSFIEKVLIIFTFLFPFSMVRAIIGRLSRNFASEIDLMESADCVINAPGGVNIGVYVDWVYLWRLFVALKLKKPVAIYSISFGPLPQKMIFKRVSLFVLKGVRFLSLRDRKSQEYARQLDIPFYPSIDTAFLENNAARELPPELKFLAERTYMVMVPNELNKWHPQFRTISAAAIDAFYIDIIDSMLKQNLDIVLLPQLFGRQNDSRYFESLKIRCRAPERVTCLEDKYDSYTQQMVIRKAKFLVGARYHSIVFAIRNRTPFFALSYEHKIEEMLSLLDLGDRSVNLRELFARDDSDATVEKIVKMYAECKAGEPKIGAAADGAGEMAFDTYREFHEKFLQATFDGLQKGRSA